ncbi:MAG: HlyD family efflux transporter periplasmic adaptor subunit [Planctomycetes bacterium]|nr:HlyD family efflux transporter periplasmic adaptor subunit [Planctomycetota bacterium]
MSDWRPSRPRAGLLLRARHVVRGATPASVWVLAVAALVWMGRTMPFQGQLVGIVDAAQSSVGAPVDGRICAVLVTLHQEVEQGQVLARLDDADVRLRLTQATYELERLRADMAREAADVEQQARATAAEHGLEAGVEQRRLASAVEAAQLGALSVRTQLEEARIRVQGVAVEADRLAALATQGMVGEPELVRVRTERDALQKRIEELASLHQEHEARVATAQQRLREFAPVGVAGLAVDTALAPLRWRLKAQEASLERIALDGRQLDLRAPIGGRVVAVTAQAGEWTAAGRALVSIVDPRPRRILAYVADAMRGQLQPQQPVRVHRGDAGLLGTAAIQSISPTVVRVPDRLWGDPRREEWAYEVVVTATGFETPGERVQLQLRP